VRDREVTGRINRTDPLDVLVRDHRRRVDQVSRVTKTTQSHIVPVDALQINARTNEATDNGAVEIKYRMSHSRPRSWVHDAPSIDDPSNCLVDDFSALPGLTITASC